MTQHISIYFLRQLVTLPQQDTLTFLDLLNSHLLPLSRQNAYQLITCDLGIDFPASLLIFVDGTQYGQSIDNMIFADAVDRAAVDEQLEEDVEVELVDCLFVVFDVFGESDFVLHVLYLFLGGVESHASHHVGDCLEGHLAV